MLGDEGYAVTAESGEKALDGPRPGLRLVLLDVWLPGTDGLEVLSRIRERTPSCPSS